MKAADGLVIAAIASAIGLGLGSLAWSIRVLGPMSTLVGIALVLTLTATLVRRRKRLVRNRALAAQILAELSQDPTLNSR